MTGKKVVALIVVLSLLAVCGATVVMTADIMTTVDTHATTAEEVAPILVSYYTGTPCEEIDPDDEAELEELILIILGDIKKAALDANVVAEKIGPYASEIDIVKIMLEEKTLYDDLAILSEDMKTFGNRIAELDFSSANVTYDVLICNKEFVSFMNGFVNEIFGKKESWNIQSIFESKPTATTIILPIIQYNAMTEDILADPGMYNKENMMNAFSDLIDAYNSGDELRLSVEKMKSMSFMFAWLTIGENCDSEIANLATKYFNPANTTIALVKMINTIKAYANKDISDVINCVMEASGYIEAYEDQCDAFMEELIKSGLLNGKASR